MAVARHRRHSARTQLWRRPAAVIAATALMVLGAAVPASADILRNDLVVSGSATITAGASTTINYLLDPSDRDGGNSACNVGQNQASQATLELTVPSGVSATTPAPLTRCDVLLPVTFTSSTPGSYLVTARVIRGTAPVGGVFTEGATFTLVVVSPDSTPPVLSLPAAVTVEATAAQGTIATWTASAYDDGDASASAVSCTPANGSGFALGTTTVSCSASDSRGNTATGTFPVHVVDTTGPVVTVPHLTAEATSAAGATVTFAGTAADLVDGPITDVLCPTSGSTFPLGTTSTSCTAHDAARNTGTGTGSVTVVDTTPPAITVAHLTVEATSADGAAATFAPTAVDLVAGSVPVTCDSASGSLFPLGTTSVGCTATDGTNAATATFTVTVSDTTAPTVHTTDVVAEATGPGGASVTFEVTASDAVDADPEVSCSPASGAQFALGVTTVDCSATDDAERTGTGTFTVTVRDTTPPVLHLPPVVLEAAGPTGTIATIDGSGASATDLVSGARDVVCLVEADVLYPLGDTLVTCTATDVVGNVAEGSRVVQVVDTTAPVLTVTDLVREATSGDGAVVTFAPGVTDAVTPGLVATCEPASGSTFGLGTTTVTCSATDNAGLTGHASFLVTVEDTTAPSYDPADIRAEATGPGGAAVSWSTTARDLVDGDVQAECSPAPGTEFRLGETAVTCEVRDARDNLATSVLTVTVVDTTAPVVTVPQDMTVEATGPAGAPVTFTATAADVVAGAPPVTCTPSSGATFGFTPTVVECTSTDGYGNVGSASFTVTVVDTTAPVITAPHSVTREATGPGGAVVEYEVTAVDLVDGDVDVSCTPPSGSLFALDSTTVSCSVVDAAGNDDDVSFPVLVTDTTAPDLLLPDSFAVEATSRFDTVVTYTASAEDVVDGVLTPSCTPPSGSIFALGTHTVDCEVSDTRDNRAAADFDVTVQDTTEPVLYLGDVGVEATGPDGAPAEYSATATDTVWGELDVTCSRPSGATFPLGTTTVLCSATDGSGNTGTGTFVVTVVDTTAPVVTIEPIPVAEATGRDGAAVLFSATAIDLVDGTVPVTCTPPSGSTFAIGSTPVTCTATDRAGNTGSSSSTVLVQDTTAPSITLTSVTAEATGPDGAVVTYEATATDAVDGSVTPVCEPASGSLFPLGTTSLRCTAVDDAGNEAVHETATVTVQDTTDPVLMVPTDIVTTATSAAGATVTYVATATDLVSTPSVVCTPPSGSTFPLGTTTVSCTATDAAGNDTTATFTVAVRLSWSGFLAPIGLDGRSSFKAGSTIPVKFTLTGASIPATGTPATISVAKVGAAAGTETIQVVSTSAADTGTRFRVADGQYIYNLSTKGWSEGQYVIRVDLLDGVDRSTMITVRK